MSPYIKILIKRDKELTNLGMFFDENKGDFGLYFLELKKNFAFTVRPTDLFLSEETFNKQLIQLKRYINIYNAKTHN